MCGIAGVLAKEGPPSSVALEALRAALAHRGPDGSGIYAEDGTGLVHTRLSIIDLATGDQPLYGEGGTVLVANGEIYNYVELKRAFPDGRFATHSDCELPLFTFRRDGARFADALRGMYAIALREGHTVYLARDPFGIKPLYYADTDAGIVFASELQAILSTGLVPRVHNPEKAREVLQLQFTTGRETIIRGIHRVLPGETLTVRNGRIAERHRRAALPTGAPAVVNEADALARLDQVLMDSVLVHQRADVPYGMFLSGGVDSSVLLACMARLNERPVRAFTAGFPGTDVHDEREHARRVARAAGAEHIEIAVTEADFWRDLPAVAAAMDDPAADYATIPTFRLAAETAKGLKVVLTGEGGDELFAGYGRYRTAALPFWRGGRPMRRRGFLDRYGILRDASRSWRAGLAASERDSAVPGWTKLQRAQAIDCVDWLPHDLLTKLDRCLMAHGLEGRTPFLDPVMADFAFALPDHLKWRNGHGKYLLRRWLERALPDAQPFAPKKGFTVPVGRWMMPKAAALGDRLAALPGVDELCRPGAVQALFRRLGRGEVRVGQACWQILFYALWHRVHVEARPERGDVLALLEAR